MSDTSDRVREYSSNVIDSVGDGVIVVDDRLAITLMNPAAEEITGISRKQALGAPFQVCFRGQDAITGMVEKTSTTGMTISDHENLVIRKGFRVIPVSATTSPLLTPAGDSIGTILVLRELTKIRELEEAVRQADRLSSLGTLAAGLAHEIKNPLGGIKGAAQLLERELPEGSELREHTTVMLKEVARVNKIVEELLDLTTPRRLAQSEVNLHKILGDIVMLQKQTARNRNIVFQQDFDLSLPPFLADEGLLTQLFLNLIKNAMEAMEEMERQGTIRIVTRFVSEYSMTKKGRRRSRMVGIDITDDGPGMTEDQLTQVFTPFFTTKSGGTGLGLAICQKIVTEHRGMIKVDSKQGKGTVFSITLPLVL
jgi:two-component system nitrogen regulation sensor histidine kinase GlnL